MTNNEMRKKKIAAVILAAGYSLRMKNKIPKQYLKINGQEVLLYTIKNFLECDFLRKITIVVNRNWLKRAKDIVTKFSKDRRLDFVIGGKYRRESIYAALNYLKNKNIDYVIIHDAVRPFIDKTMIKKVAAMGVKNGAAIVGIKGTDLMVEARQGKVTKIYDSTDLVFTQTPECYKFNLILLAHHWPPRRKDLAATNLELMLAIKKDIRFIKNQERNLKLTYTSDLKLTATLLAKYHK